MEKALCLLFQLPLPVATFFFYKNPEELGIYLESSLVPRRTPAPLYHNLQIWDLEFKHTGMPLVWPFRGGRTNGVVCE